MVGVAAICTESSTGCGIADTSSAEPQHTRTHCMWATGCDKAAHGSKVTFFKHKFSGHTAPMRTGQAGNLNSPPPSQ